MQITITVPDRIGEALESKGGELDMKAAELLKHLLFCACHAPEGVVLRLTLPPLPAGEVPLFEQAGVRVDGDAEN